LQWLIQEEKMHTARLVLGKFNAGISSHKMPISQPVALRLEELINRGIHLKTQSLIVRLDMAPWSGEGTAPIYELESAPGGLMTWGVVRSKLAILFCQKFPEKYHRILVSFATSGTMLNQIRRLADTAVCLHPDWYLPYDLLARQTGWNIYHDWNVPAKSRVYFSGTDNEVERSNGILQTDPNASKNHILELTGGEVFDPEEIRKLTIDHLLQNYPEGFVIKPLNGWGARHVYIWTVSEHRRRGHTRSRIVREINDRDHQWMVQPYFEPKFHNEGFVAWRIYAVRSNSAESFKIVGGVWNWRKSLIVHGATDSVFGEVPVLK
jgi:hypothetical protein